MGVVRRGRDDSKMLSSLPVALPILFEHSMNGPLRKGRGTVRVRSRPVHSLRNSTYYSLKQLRQSP